MQHTSDRIWLSLRRALQRGHLEARRRLLRLNIPDTDDPAFPFYPIDGSKHTGDPQHLVDAVVLDTIETSLRRDFPEIRVVGEESLRSISARRYPIAVVDPIDGTKPYSHLGAAWAVVLLVLEWSEDSARLWIPSAGIASSNGLLVGIREERLVTIGLLEDETTDIALVDIPASSSSGALSIACVGAKPSARNDFLRLTRAVPEATVFNLGGNPVVPGLLTGDLDAIVAFKSQCNWDAVYALAVAIAGGTVGSVEGRVFSTSEVLSWFHAPPHGDQEEMKNVPPIIVTKNRDVYNAIVKGLSEPGAKAV